MRSLTTTGKINPPCFRINDTVDFLPEKGILVSCSTGEKFTLYNTASRCLVVLIIKNGEVVSHHELYKWGWEEQGKIVTPNTLYQTISELRKQLRNAGMMQNIIVTHPRKGWSLAEKTVIEENHSKIPERIVTAEASEQIKRPGEIKNVRELYNFVMKFFARVK